MTLGSTREKKADRKLCDFRKINVLRQKPLCFGPISTDPTMIGDMSRDSPCADPSLLGHRDVDGLVGRNPFSFLTDNNMELG